MRKTFFVWANIIFFLSFITLPVFALDSSLPNNKFGIHIADTSDQDLRRASDLVNSTGGKWGYVTLVIQENDRNRDKWQQVFEKLREFHLIPIVRLATSPDGAKWKRPSTDEAESWANFLNSLKWVVKDRYIILFNEPNHGAEWGGIVDPGGYADVASEFISRLKDTNKNFFVMLAGMDASAPQAPPNFEDEGEFLTQVFQKKPELKDSISGLSSHSYPNPGFLGSPYDTGRRSVRTYEWEINLLKQLGVSHDLPVFITETGWPHSHYSPEVIGDYLKIAYEAVWLPDDRVIAVTPFVLNYQGEPFSSFSWIQPGGEGVYPHYVVLQQEPKKEGEPEIIEHGTISFSYFKELLVRSTYHFQLKVLNSGEAIWDKDDGYQFKLKGLDEKQYIFSDLLKVKPGEGQLIDLYLKTDPVVGTVNARIILNKKDKKILEGKEWSFHKLPLPKVQFTSSLSPKILPQSGEMEFQIFDSDEQLVYKRKGVQVKNNRGEIPEIANIALGEKYRVVVLRPYYLPRQTYVVFKKGTNYFSFKPMLPLDFNQNGRLDWGDLTTLFTQPALFSLLLP